MKVYRIGFLSRTPAESIAPLLSALKEALRALGYIEGRNIVFESRYGEGRLERLPDLAAELVRLRVDVIVVGANPAIAAARRATATIPIVMATDQLRAEPAGSIPARRRLRREDPPRGQARPPTKPSKGW